VNDLQGALDRLKASAQQDQNEGVSDVLLDLEVLVLASDHWPPEFFVGIKNLLQDGTFLRLADSWQLARFLGNNWEQLTEEQRTELRPILTSSFDKHKDWMGAFGTAEIIAERYADETALHTFSELASTTRIPALALVPHGLQKLAQTTTEPRLKARAVQQLQLLASSSIEQVRNEASEALQRLGQG
jgi:hypothetical protein